MIFKPWALSPAFFVAAFSVAVAKHQNNIQNAVEQLVVHQTFGGRIRSLNRRHGGVPIGVFGVVGDGGHLRIGPDVAIVAVAIVAALTLFVVVAVARQAS